MKYFQLMKHLMTLKNTQPSHLFMKHVFPIHHDDNIV